ncbi:MAG: glycosyltransferase family 4 protein [Thermoguttaceae bacterium]|jgi:glycosyltransferase involved in cell wall biosynthesis
MSTYPHKTVLILCNGARIFYLTRFELVKALLDRGYTVYLSAPHSDKSAPFVEAGCRMIDTPLDRRGLSPWNDLKLYFKYKRILKEIRPDILLTFTIKPNIYGIRAGSKVGIYGIPTMTGLGTSIQHHGLLQRIVFSLYRRYYRHVPSAFFQNCANAELFRLLGLVRSEQIVTVSGSGVNLQTHAFQPYPDPSEPVRFLFIGRLMEEKGCLEYVEAARRIRQTRPDVRFGVLGFSEEPEILERIKSLSDEGIIEYFGYVQDVRPYIGKAHAVVHPSWHEGMANVLLEAGAAGRPVIASKISGCCETFNEGVTGFGFCPRNLDDLCDKLNRFLALSPEDRAAMGTAARIKTENESDRRKVVETYLAEIDKTLK